MIAQYPGRLRAALAALAMTLAAAAASSHAAEFDDFAGTWQIDVVVVVQAGEARQAISQIPGTLELEQAGASMEGVLAISAGAERARIPLQGATLGEQRLNFQIAGGQAGASTEFDEAIRRLFNEFGLDPGSASIRLDGWLQAEDLNLTGEIDVLGLTIPGVADAIQLMVSGVKSAGPGVPEEEDEPFEPEAPEVEQVEEVEPPPIHAGADAEVAALSEGDLADQEAAVQLSAARAIAEQERKRRERLEALRRIERVHAFEYDLVGDNADAVMQEASIRALTSTAARLYYGNYVLVGRDLLRPYLSANGDAFILDREVLSQRGTADGRRRVKVRVVVDTDKLYDDLDSKHFIAEPKFRPVMAVTLAETLNDEPIQIPLGRAVLQELLILADMRVEDLPLAGGMDGVDAAADPELLRRGRAEAERLDGDVLVTGSAHLYGPSSRVILFDQFYEVSGSLRLQFIRIDSGHVLRTYSGTFTATADTAETAIRRCLIGLASEAVQRMTAGFLEEWESTMLDRSDYRVCIMGATPDQIGVFQEQLRSLSPEAQSYLKSNFADVAVLNVNLPGTRPEQFENFLRRQRAPQFKIIPNGRGGYELRVI
jgi:hypothetical protein